MKSGGVKVRVGGTELSKGFEATTTIVVLPKLVGVIVKEAGTTTGTIIPPTSAVFDMAVGPPKVISRNTRGFCCDIALVIITPKVSGL